MISLVRAELRRLLTTRLWLWALLAAAMLGAIPVGLFALIGPENADPPLPALDTEEGVGITLGIGAFSVIGAALFGAAAVTSEYRHRTITTTFLFVPRRGNVLTAKLLAYLVGGLGYGLTTAAAAGIALYGALAVHGTTAGASVATVAGLLLRLAAAMAAYTLIGVGIGALVRNQFIALACLGAYLYMGENLLLLIPGVNTVYPLLPGGATAALTNFTALTEAVDEATGAAPRLLPPALGAALLVGYAAAAAALAIALPLRRDVT